MSPGSGPEYACSAVARWLPRALAGSVLAAALIVALELDPGSRWPGALWLRGLVAAVGGVMALWIVRSGAELRLRVALGADALELVGPRGTTRVAYRDLAALDFAPAFGTSRSWLPAMVLVGRDDREWRLPTLIDGADRLVLELLERCARSDLAARADARKLVARMSRGTHVLVVGYGLAGSVLGLATTFSAG